MVREEVGDRIEIGKFRVERIERANPFALEPLSYTMLLDQVEVPARRFRDEPHYVIVNPFSPDEMKTLGLLGDQLRYAIHKRWHPETSIEMLQKIVADWPRELEGGLGRDISLPKRSKPRRGSKKSHPMDQGHKLSLFGPEAFFEESAVTKANKAMGRALRFYTQEESFETFLGGAIRYFGHDRLDDEGNKQNHDYYSPGAVLEFDNTFLLRVEYTDPTDHLFFHIVGKSDETRILPADKNQIWEVKSLVRDFRTEHGVQLGTQALSALASKLHSWEQWDLDYLIYDFFNGRKFVLEVPDLELWLESLLEAYYYCEKRRTNRPWAEVEMVESLRQYNETYRVRMEAARVSDAQVVTVMENWKRRQQLAQVAS